MKVALVTSGNRSSRIFADLFRRFVLSSHVDATVCDEAEDGYDIYHYHRPQLEEALRYPSVVTVHHDLGDPAGFVDFAKFEPRYREASAIVCLNTTQKTALAEIGITQTHVIPHGYDDQLFGGAKTRNRSPGDLLRLGIISRRYERRVKGEVLLEELLDLVSPELVEFTFVGAFRSKDAHLVRSAGFAARVLEHLPYRVFPSLYSEIDALMMMSNFEGGPACLPEAVATHTPILSTRVGMGPDIVKDGENGFLLSFDAEDWAKTITDLALNTDGLFDRIAAGARSTNNAITWNEVVERHAVLYGRILGYSGNAADQPGSP
ncbi:MAG: glycosyltransferase family 4 protein [Pseudomonadota bacterium]